MHTGDRSSESDRGLRLSDPRFLRLEIVLLLLIAVGIRLSALYGKELERDAWKYISIAEQYRGSWDPVEIYHAEVGQHSYPPLLPMVLIAGEKLGITAKFAGLTFSVMMGSLACVGCLLLFRLLWPQYPHIGFFAGLLFAALPRAVDYSASVLRDSGYWCALIFALYFWHRGILRHRTADMVWAGVCIAFGSLMRKEGMEPLLLIGLETLLLLAIPSWRRTGFADISVRFLCRSNLIVWLTVLLLELPFVEYWYCYLTS